jgi:hypothetical protein
VKNKINQKNKQSQSTVFGMIVKKKSTLVCFVVHSVVLEKMMEDVEIGEKRHPNTHNIHHTHVNI